jgi:hypothetical protein
MSDKFKVQAAKNEMGRLRSLRASYNIQHFDPTQVINQDKIDQNLPGLFGKALAHMNDGSLLADPNEQYQVLVAMEAGDQDALAQITLGGGRKFVDSQAAFAHELVGGDPYGFSFESCPTLASNQACAELLEDYEMAICRDKSWDTINSNAVDADCSRAVDMLNAFGDDFKGLKEGGQVTRQTLFRGNCYGNQYGPHMSQFAVHDFTSGAHPIIQKYILDTGDYGNTEANFFSIQEGNIPVAQTTSAPDSYRLFSPRGLGSLIHNDFVYQFFYYAAQILVAAGVPRNAAYSDIYPDEAFVTNGGLVHMVTALADVTKNAFTAAWVHKWRNHLRLRPEEMAARVVKQEEGVLNGLVNTNFFASSHGQDTVNAIKAYNLANSGENAAYLPLMYAEGSPMHPAFPAGHATTAGAMATILKLIFADVAWTTTNLGTDLGRVLESNDGANLTDYTGDTANMTVHTELNKLAANCAMGRNVAGVHYRADSDGGNRLGEKVAVEYYKDYMSRQIQPHAQISCLGFDGNTLTIPGTTGTPFNSSPTNLKFDGQI